LQTLENKKQGFYFFFLANFRKQKKQGFYFFLQTLKAKKTRISLFANFRKLKK